MHYFSFKKNNNVFEAFLIKKVFWTQFDNYKNILFSGYS